MYRRLLLILYGLALVLMARAQTEPFARGDSCLARHDAEEALRWYDRAEPINFSQRRRLYESMARAHRLAGHYQEAVRYNELLLATQRGRNRDRVLLNLSGLWLLTGQYEKVVDALTALRPDEGEDIRLVNLSSAYLRLNRAPEALDLLDRALRTQQPDGMVYRTALQNKGYIEWALGRYPDARRDLADACRLYPPAARDRYICMGNLAVVEAGLGRLREALAHIDTVLIYQKAALGERHPDYLISLRKKAEILLDARRTDEATLLFKAYAAGERDYILANFALMTETERQNFWAAHSALLAECYATEQADPDFLFDVALFSKSVLMQTNLNLRRLLAGDPTLSAAFARLKALRTRQADAAPPTGRRQQEADSLERALVGRVAALRTFNDRLRLTSADVRRALKRSADRVVEFIQYTRNDTVRYAALVLARTGPVRFVPLFTRRELEDRLLAPAGGTARRLTVKDAIYSNRHADKNRLYADTLLGRAVWGDILAGVPRGADVYFVPDGLLHLLGIEYLCFDRPDCRLFRLSSSGVLCRRRGQASRGEATALLVGGLDYDDASAAARPAGYRPDRRGSAWLQRSGLPPAVGGGYDYLPGSRTEVDSIGTLLQSVLNLTVMRDAQGTEAAVKTALPRQALVHLSTHGFCTDYQVAPRPVYARDSIPEDLSLLSCGLVLSGANACARQVADNRNVEDGILTARELCDLDLDGVRLAVLSACQTGLGRVSVEGVSGLPRGLKKAGVDVLMVSLWQVDDRATGRLMTAFYRSLMQGHPPRRALAEAQKQLRQTEETATVSRFSPATLTAHPACTTRSYDQPCYWAAFILIDAI